MGRVIGRRGAGGRRKQIPERGGKRQEGKQPRLGGGVGTVSYNLPLEGQERICSFLALVTAILLWHF